MTSNKSQRIFSINGHATATWGAIGATGPSGSYHAQGTAGSNGPQGALGPTSSGPYILHNTNPPSSITINNNHRTVLQITADGDVHWYGKPSESADTLRKIMEGIVDERVKPSTRERMYANACRSILIKAKTMTRDELIAFLEQSIQNRESKSVILSLRELSDAEQSDD